MVSPFFFPGAPVKASRREPGFTLIEIIIYMVIAVILGVVAFMSYQPNSIKARYQAEQLRADLRHAQMLALTQSTALRFSVTAGAGGNYSVSSIGGVGAGPCTTAALKDPATGNTFSVTVDAALTLAGTATIDLDSLGRPGSCSGNPCTCTVSATDPAASYTMSGGGALYTVALKPVSGFTTVIP
jgi:type II secretory pathway pseudopilin PulG